jgi:spore maturation protein CgeB
MKIAILTFLYRQSLDAFYSTHPSIGSVPYSEHCRLLNDTMSLWASGWDHALSESGFEVLNIAVNAQPLLASWAAENSYNSADPKEIAAEQIRRFRPDIIWYDYSDLRYLKDIKSSLNSLRLVLGWAGSAIVNYETFRETDAVISCAPESVVAIQKAGINAYHLHHAFDPHINSYIREVQNRKGLSFIGQIIRSGEYHTERERLLKKLCAEIDISIYSPAYLYGTSELFLTPLRQGAYMFSRLARLAGLSGLFAKNDRMRKVIELREMPRFPFDKSLRKKLKPPVYGVEMYRQIAGSQVVLNIHADSSPQYASNMRLFEITGAGSCLLTDWKKNISELFEPDRDIVTYRSAEECLEKARWLMNHREESEAIAKRGRERTLKSHTYLNRVPAFKEIIAKHLRQ